MLLNDAVHQVQEIAQLKAAYRRVDLTKASNDLIHAYGQDIEARARAGLVPPARARKVAVCVADEDLRRAFEAFATHAAGKPITVKPSVVAGIVHGTLPKCDPFIRL